MSKRYLFKIVIAGSGGCGKTTLLTRFITKTFKSNTRMTIGIDFSVKELDVTNGNSKLQILDFGGEKRFRTIFPAYCKGSNGCLLIYDMTRPKTFFELEEWIKIIRRNTDNIPIILIGTKFDLINPKNPESIDSKGILQWMKENKMDEHIITSSKSGLNVHESFVKLTETLIINHIDNK